MIHIYTGDGKGKTTAASGLAIRACGSGFKVLFIQLFKSGTCNESNVFPSDIVFKRHTLEKFTWDMSCEEIDAYCSKAIICVKDALLESVYDMIIIDEFFMLTQFGRVDSEIIKLVKNCKAELVLTGRNAPEEYIEISDYVSEIKCIKHPFDKGILSREGIEY